MLDVQAELLKVTNEFVIAYKALQALTIDLSKADGEVSQLKASTMLSSGVMGLGNQAQRDAQVDLILGEYPEYRGYLELKLKHKLAWIKVDQLRDVSANYRTYLSYKVKEGKENE